MAITNAANQKPTHPLASLILSYAHGGFKPMLQFIYDHAAAKDVAEASGTDGSTELKRLYWQDLNETTAGLKILWMLRELSSSPTVLRQ